MQSLQPAYVLHSRRFRESSLVVELITPTLGRHAVLAKGALGGKGRRAALLQPFVPLLLDWRGRGELPVLTDCEAAGAAHQLGGPALYCGLYVNELVLRLCDRGDPHSTLFPVYAACIGELAGSPPENAALEPILRRFELRLLEELGVGLALERDHRGQAIDPHRRYDYRLDEGAVPVAGAEAGYAGATLLALARGRFDAADQRREARRLMRRVIDARLGGRPLRSRELFRPTRTTP